MLLLVRRMYSLICAVLYLLSLAAFSSARRLPTLYWNSSNPLFTDRTRFPPKGDIGSSAAYIEVEPMDTMDIVCPTYNKQNHTEERERLIIYQVSDLSFMNCELDSRSQVFLVCDSPLRKVPLAHRIVFRSFSPLPNGFEYQPGRSYYLISTSNGSIEGMNNTRRGLCMSHNLRLRIDVRPVNDSAVSLSSADVSPSDINPKFILRNGKPVLPIHKEEPIDARIQKPFGEVSNEINAANTDESVLFAAKHGLDLNRLEYVRQLARNGAEGDFPFLQNSGEHNIRVDSSSQDMSALGMSYVGKDQRGEGGPSETRNSLAGEEGSSSNRQAQRWVSSEDQRRYGSEVMMRRYGNAASPVEDLRHDMGDRQDYLVDETSSSSSVLFSTRGFIVALTLISFPFALQS